MKLKSYLSIGAGAFAVTAISTAAQATIIHQDINEWAETGAGEGTGVYTYLSIDITQDGTTDYAFELKDDSKDAIFFYDTPHFVGPHDALNARFSMVGGNCKLDGTDMSGPALGTGTYETLKDENDDGCFGMGRGYLGLNFELDSVVRFGWIDIELSGDLNNLRLDVYSAAYEDSGAAIRAGDTGARQAVSEPHSLALLALGAVGLGAYRRKRSRKLAA